MKICPFCAEEIQEAAIKCKHCGEFLSKQRGKWYYKNTSLAVLFFCVGPLMLPLVWMNPRYGRIAKIVLTVIILALTYYLTLIFAHSMRSIMSYYQELQAAIAEAS